MIGPINKYSEVRPVPIPSQAIDSFVPWGPLSLNTALLVVFVVGLLCACPRCFLAAHMVAIVQ